MAQVARFARGVLMLAMLCAFLGTGQPSRVVQAAGAAQEGTEGWGTATPTAPTPIEVNAGAQPGMTPEPPPAAGGLVGGSPTAAAPSTPASAGFRGSFTLYPGKPGHLTAVAEPP